MSEFAGTPNHFRLHRQAAEALDALEPRYVWLRLTVIGEAPPVSDAALERPIREIALWLNEIRHFPFAADGGEGERFTSHQALGDGFRIVVQARERSPEFRSDEFPLVGNPTPSAAYYI